MGVANGTDGDKVEVILGLEDVVFIADYVGTTKTTLVGSDVGTAFNLDTAGTAIDLDNALMVPGLWLALIMLIRKH